MTAYRDRIMTSAYDTSYWQMDETSGTAIDCETVNSGTDVNLTTMNSPTLNQAGPNAEEKSIYFNGTHTSSHQHLVLNNGVNDSGLENRSPIAIEFWCKVASGHGHSQMLVCQDPYYNIYIDSSDRLNIYYNSNGSNTILKTGVADGNWHHIVIYWTASTSSGNFCYVDGVSAATNWSAGAATSTDDFAVGSVDRAAGYYDQALDGYISNLAIYRSAPSQAWIEGNYDAMQGSDANINVTGTSIAVAGKKAYPGGDPFAVVVAQGAHDTDGNGFSTSSINWNQATLGLFFYACRQGTGTPAQITPAGSWTNWQFVTGGALGTVSAWYCYVGYGAYIDGESIVVDWGGNKLSFAHVAVGLYSVPNDPDASLQAASITSGSTGTTVTLTGPDTAATSRLLAWFAGNTSSSINAVTGWDELAEPNATAPVLNTVLATRFGNSDLTYEPTWSTSGAHSGVVIEVLKLFPQLDGVIMADPGAITVTSNPSYFVVDKTVSATVTSIALTSNSSTVSAIKNVNESATAASIAVAGQSATLPNVTLLTTSTSIAVTGQASEITTASVIATTATIIVTGRNASVTNLLAGTTSIAIAGHSATVDVATGTSISATTATLTVTSNSATVLVSVLVPATSTSYNGVVQSWVTSTATTGTTTFTVNSVKAENTRANGTSAGVNNRADVVVTAPSGAVGDVTITIGFQHKHYYTSGNWTRLLKNGATLLEYSIMSSTTVLSVWTGTMTPGEVATFTAYLQNSNPVGGTYYEYASIEYITLNYNVYDTAVHASVEAGPSNIALTGLAATPSTNVGISVVPVLTNVQVSGRDPNVGVNGGFILSTDTASLSLVGRAPTITTVRVIEVSATTSTITISGKNANPSTGPDNLTFTFINPATTAFTARDADQLIELDLGASFNGQTKMAGLRVGNTSSVSTNFTISAQGLNTDLVSSVTFSVNKVDWATSILLESIPKNGLTDVVWLRLVTPENALVSPGSFVINVEQTNAE